MLIVRVDRDGRARKAKSGRKDSTRNRTLDGARMNKPVNSVLSFVGGPSSYRTFPAPVRSCIHLTRGIHTPPTRCFPVRASRRRAKRRVTRVSSANNLKLNLTGLSSSSLLYPSPAKHRVLVLPWGPLRYPLALLRLLRLVIEGRVFLILQEM